MQFISELNVQFRNELFDSKEISYKVESMSFAKPKKSIPFEFILDELEKLYPRIKPMFGAHGIYVEDKIVFIVREKTEHLRDNGVWLATTLEHHDSLRRDFPNIRSIEIFGPGPSGWQNLPVDSDDFESAVLRACELVLQGDLRIGKIPKSKLRRKKSSSTSRSAKKSKTQLKQVLPKKKLSTQKKKTV